MPRLLKKDKIITDLNFSILVDMVDTSKGGCSYEFKSAQSNNKHLKKFQAKMQNKNILTKDEI